MPSVSTVVEPWLRLALAPEIGPAIAHRLLGQFGDPESVFEASSAELGQVRGLGAARIAGLRSTSIEKLVARELELAEKRSVRIICLGEHEYPRSMRELACPPLVLYVSGRLAPEDEIAVTVVGPRKPSTYARTMTSTLLGPLAAVGLTVVSGLASGIDAEAHRAALDCGGRTVAVVGQGLGTPVYPSTNRALARRIVEDDLGAIISPFPMAARPEAHNFPHRNELLAALGLGTLIVEAAERSGALITARHAGDFGRMVMACPGDATRPSARGSNRLLAEGAVLIQRSDDVLAALSQELTRLKAEFGQAEPGPDEPAGTEIGVDDHSGGREAPAGSEVPDLAVSEGGESADNDLADLRSSADPLGTLIRRLLRDEHRPIDFVLDGCIDAGFTQSAVVQKLLTLEMNGLIRQYPGRIYALIK